MEPANYYHGRWGYYPCEFQLYCKLKDLHRWYWQTLGDFHRWHRWWRKEEQNRIGPEPLFCPLFVVNKTWYKPVRRHGVIGEKVYPKTVLDHGIIDLYHYARMPQPIPIAVLDAETVSQIETLHDKAVAYFVT